MRRCNICKKFIWFWQRKKRYYAPIWFGWYCEHKKCKDEEDKKVKEVQCVTPL